MKDRLEIQGLPSDCRFGLWFTGFASIAGGFAGWTGSYVWPWFAAAAVFLAVSMIIPSLRHPFNANPR
jgi:hypothetical protein